MKVSRLWLQKYFDTELPNAETLTEALTFHVFEIEATKKVGKDDVLDVKVTPNRGHDCLSHRGIAKELSAILNIPLASDPLQEKLDLSKTSDVVSVSIQPDICKRYIAGYIRGISIKPSPKWLQERLAAIGQRSVNNIVDTTNFVMFNIGQPLHVFDATKLAQGDTNKKILVRLASENDMIKTLDNKEYTLKSNDLLIVDGIRGHPIGIAGIKGGIFAGISHDTTDIIIESANFDGPSVRRTAAALKLRTDASSRFEQVLSPELAAYGMQSVVEMILKLAGGELICYTDIYPNPPKPRAVSVSLKQVQQLLGHTFGEKEIVDAFVRLGFRYTQTGDVFTVAVPFERLDLEIPEDLVEEVGRIIGYNHVSSKPLPAIDRKPAVNPQFYANEKAREEYISKGYSEVITSVFADRGERMVLNKIDGARPYLRGSINLSEARTRNLFYKDLLGLTEIKLFEIGPVWRGGGEPTMLAYVDETGHGEEKILKPAVADRYEDLPLSQIERYKPFSKYPYIVRDVAMWVPQGGEAMGKILEIFSAHGSKLLRNAILFDQFKKNNRISYAFHLVFQSFERTLQDSEANTIMEKIYNALRKEGFEIR